MKHWRKIAMDELKEDLFNRILSDKSLMHPHNKKLYQDTAQRCQEILNRLNSTSQVAYDAESREVAETLYKQRLERIDSKIKTLQDRISFLQQMIPQSKYVISIHKLIKMYAYQLESLTKARASVKAEPYIRRKNIDTIIKETQEQLNNAQQKLERLEKESLEVDKIKQDLDFLFPCKMEDSTNV